MVVVIVLLVVLSSQCLCEVDWCKLRCDGDVEHTMCIYKPHRNFGNCTNIEDILTQEDRKELLHMHNEYRNELAGGLKKGWPRAANMREMSWDDASESVALRWAQQCVEGYDECRRTIEFPYVGQTYAVEDDTDVYPTHTGGFHLWVDRLAMIDNPESIIERFPGDKSAFFTQVVWADSFKLGCSAIKTELHYDKVYKAVILVCNYGPEGNVWDAKMYEIGEPCSKCPSGTECNQHSAYPHLCALTTSFDVPSRSCKSYFKVSVIIFSMATLIISTN
ncbi:hypothetical protein GE061_003856 [Apolygus lucorum]|uniref:SCP domain-containing protein n=1 Tax=Apolygus lucorum TaxID=248454 RepID=A0A8S9X1K9_APOLU|nr:hypothetical protein GE061_003856 [Apolygus lucorum]